MCCCLDVEHFVGLHLSYISNRELRGDAGDFALCNVVTDKSLDCFSGGWGGTVVFTAEVCISSAVLYYCSFSQPHLASATPLDTERPCIFCAVALNWPPLLVIWFVCLSVCLFVDVFVCCFQLKHLRTYAEDALVLGHGSRTRVPQMVPHGGPGAGKEAFLLAVAPHSSCKEVLDDVCFFLSSDLTTNKK